MGKNERQAYLKAIRARYRRAKKRANEIQRRYKRYKDTKIQRYKDTKDSRLLKIHKSTNQGNLA